MGKFFNDKYWAIIRDIFYFIITGIGGISLMTIGISMIFDLSSFLSFLGGFAVFIIGLLLLLFFILPIFESFNADDKTKENDNYYTCGYGNIWLKKTEGYSHYDIVGIYYRNLKFIDMGEFDGFVMAETNNKYDKYAIAVFKKDGTHVGYVQKGNSRLYKYIIKNGGSISAYGHLSCDPRCENFRGEVAINENL